MLYLERRCKKASSHCTLLLPMTFFTIQSAFPSEDCVTVLWASQKVSALARALEEICTHSSIHLFILQQLSIINSCCPFFYLCVRLPPRTDNPKVSHFLLVRLNLKSPTTFSLHCPVMIPGALSHGYGYPLSLSSLLVPD